jgi:hypothetical protein
MIGSIMNETPRYSVFERKPVPHVMGADTGSRKELAPAAPHWKRFVNHNAMASGAKASPLPR